MSYKQMTGNIISATKVEPVGTSEAGVASGVWNLDDVYDYNRGANWPEAGVPDPSLFIENNFSTFLYQGTGSGSNTGSQTIENGIDLSGEGGLVWIKHRSIAYNNVLVDTERGANEVLLANTTAANVSGQDVSGYNEFVTSFNSNGFSVGSNNNVNYNGGSGLASWTFKKAPKFFDIVTYEGTGSARTVAHSLNSTVGMILIKNKDATDNWAVYHRANTAAPETDYLILNTDAATADSANWWNDTAPTTSVFTVGTNVAVNTDGENYIAYVFAHETGDDSMIQCGGYTGNGSATGPVINLGWEPQFLLFKRASGGTANWMIVDDMRGLNVTGRHELIPNLANAEYNSTSSTIVEPTSTGFKLTAVTTQTNKDDSSDYVYMAIRRPNMATITDATDVFKVDQGDTTSTPAFNSGFVTDFEFYRNVSSGSDFYTSSRLTGNKYLATNSTAAESSSSSFTWDFMDGFREGNLNTTFYSWMWKRAKGYFDVVAYEGTGANRTVAHGLSVVPEMMWIKSRDDTESWVVYHANMAGTPESNYLYLNEASALNVNSNVIKYFNNTAPTSSVFTVGIEDRVNTQDDSYVAYLFATLAGVSKLGTVAHSGSSTDVDCGFSAGARFVLLRRTDAGSGWYCWDSVRGIVAGNDPYLLLNTTAAQVTNTDFIDPLASGFQISGDFTDGTYIFYAIA